MIIKYYGLHYYGGDGPVAILNIDGHEGIYDQQGVESMIFHYNALNQDTDELITLLNEIQVNRYSPLPDLTRDQLSGQSALF